MESRDNSVRILARSLRKQLDAQGYEHRHVVALATALLDEVTTALAATTARQASPDHRLHARP